MRRAAAFLASLLLAVGPVAARPKPAAPALGSITQTLTLSGSVNGQAWSWTGPLTLIPLASGQWGVYGDGGPLNLGPVALALTAVSVSPATVTSGQGSTGTVTLNRAPQSAVQITLASDGLIVPATVTINVGQTQGTFAIATPQDRTTDTWFSVTATYNGQSQSVSLLVKAAVVPKPSPTLSVFQFLGANPVTAPSGTTVGVTLSGVAPADTVLGLTSSNPLVVPEALRVRAGSDQGSASLFIRGVPAGSTPVTLTATLGAVTRSLTLTVLPPQPAPGPAVSGYLDPDGQPIPASGVWVGSPVVINGRGFGAQVGPTAVSPQGIVTWQGIALTTYMWNDTQIGVTLSYGALGSGTAPLIVTRFDGTTITGPPLAVRTPVGNPAIRRIGKAGAVGEVVGEGFGTTPGVLFIHGYPVPAATWSDTRITWVLTGLVTATDEAAVRRADGGYSSFLADNDLAALPAPGSRVRQGRGGGTR